VWADVAAAEPLARHLRALLDLVEAHALPADSVTVWPTMGGRGSVSVDTSPAGLERWAAAAAGSAPTVWPEALSTKRDRVLMSISWRPGADEAWFHVDASRPATDADRERLGGAW
jgi:hypothetical protein